jgi:hypothetical protein
MEYGKNKSALLIIIAEVKNDREHGTASPSDFIIIYRIPKTLAIIPILSPSRVQKKEQLFHFKKEPITRYFSQHNRSLV